MSPHPKREQIEQAVARGWADDRICDSLSVSLKAVIGARRAMDDLAECDAFAVIDPRARHERCRNGHPFDAENTYQRPGSSKRECRVCRADRNAARYGKRAA